MVEEYNSTSDNSNGIKHPESVVEQLQTALEGDPVDIGEVIRLTNLLAKGEEGVVRFSVDAGLINRLGRELMSRAETAVAELIKNAYDADATEVSLYFDNVEEPNGTLTIVDNGSGMTRQQLINGFMRLSSSDKIDNPISPRFKRQRAGRKGIGRFAVQRLGQQLEIITQTKESPHAFRVLIDWDQFEPGTDLGTIASRIEETDKSSIEGTTLKIYRLREAWTEPTLRRVYRNVSELIQPYTLRDSRNDSLEVRTAEQLQEERTIKNGDFEVAIYAQTGLQPIVIDEITQVLEHATAVIEGYVDETGQGYWSVRSDKVGVQDVLQLIGASRENDEAPFTSLRNVDFKAYYFIFETDLIPRSVRGGIRELTNERGGIRLYRNGYRVAPYANPGNDWLGLDYSSQVRRVLVPHSNKNFIGIVEVNDPLGLQFEETASREGLIENDVFTELADFVYRAVVAGVARIGAARGKKVYANQKGWQPTRRASESLKEKAERIRALIRENTPASQDTEEKPSEEAQRPENHNLSKTPNQDDTQNDNSNEDNYNINLSAKELKILADDLDSDADESARYEENLLQEVNLLRVLASLGLVIAEFTHEVKFVLGAAKISADDLIDTVEVNSDSYVLAKQLTNNIDRFQSFASYFYRAVSDSNPRAIAPQNLEHVVNDWHKVVKSSAKEIGVDLHIYTPEYEILTCPMHSSEWASVLYNLYSNSIKAISRARSGRGKIQVIVGCENRKAYLEFSDNGDGISSEDEERVFDAFYTTTTPAKASALEEDALQGTGLGLKIVQDIAESYKGQIQLLDAPDGYVTCFRFEVPEASSKQKEEYGY